MDSAQSLLASLTPEQREALLRSLTPAEARALEYEWRAWARPSQIAPLTTASGLPWNFWLILAGRGFGKTRSGAEWVREKAEQSPPGTRIALVARISSDVRDVLVEGESGILAISPPWFMPTWEPSKRRLTWPNGVRATTYSADEPNQLRGPQHHYAWADELAAWQYPDAWDQLSLGLRLGTHPQCCVTTTPRPTKLIRDLITDPATVITKGSTYDNRANLAASFLRAVVRRFEGTRLGRQELNAEILDDAPGALWKRSRIDELRRATHPDLKRIVVAIDPAVTSGEDSDETGIVVCGLGDDDRGYVLADITGKYSPNEWAAKAVFEYYTRSADRIVAEVNNGGDLVETTVRTVDARVPFTAVRASRGKRTRAEPIAALYEQGRVHHVGLLGPLEDQLCNWDPMSSDRSPDRLDALVWALTELMVEDLGGGSSFDGNLPI